MRYIIKGGLWKNSEDEILKAAVMKYGLNQWSRISSLLVRKSASQCKQRWYEWLDPQIKKTDWSRLEDEKLLHLSKTFPNQWRTIAPLVGRTPMQCLERYDKLLDQVQGKADIDMNDPKRLRPGEQDPNPESKPAKPDPIHMDEDEKEMLAESRVRLSNTKGKKAKRIIREKMIEQARRLASLQKRRELKAVGIELKVHKKAKHLDYNSEVPFERKVPEFVYQTMKEEDPKANLNLQNMNISTIEGSLRVEDEQKKRKVDQKRLKKLREENLEKEIQKEKEKQLKLFESKTKLILPQPQVLDKDLEQFSKLTQVQEVSGTENQATKALVGNYTQREFTPTTTMRTPRQQDSVRLEALNAVALQITSTPLIGGENQPLHSGIEAENEIFAKPAQIQQTPNVLVQMMNPKSQIGQGKSQTGQTPFTSVSQTPRDEFGLNFKDKWEDPNVLMNEQKLIELQQQQMKEQIKKKLEMIPEPKIDFSITLPEMFNEDEEEKKLADQEDVDRKLKEQEQRELEKNQRQKSLALQKNLPRPFKLPTQLYDHIYNFKDMNEYRREAEIMLESEIIKVLSFDNQNFPFLGVQPLQFRMNLDYFNNEEMNDADLMIQSEMDLVKNELKHGQFDKDHVQKRWGETFNNVVVNLEENKVQDLRNINSFDEKTYIQQRLLENRKNQYIKETKKLDNLETKVKTLFGGYQRLISIHQKQINEQHQQINQQQIEYDVFKHLQFQEQRSVQGRIQELMEYEQFLNEDNVKLQEKFTQLSSEKMELLNDEDEYFQNLVEKKVEK